jgi:hypothetical protein
LALSEDIYWPTGLKPVQAVATVWLAATLDDNTPLWSIQNSRVPVAVTPLEVIGAAAITKAVVEAAGAAPVVKL